MRMRQKVSISQLPIRLGIFLLLYFVPQSLSAQENNDSTHILRNGASITPDDVLKQANINLFPEKSTTYSLYSPGQLEHIPRPYCNHLGRVGKDWSDKVGKYPF